MFAFPQKINFFSRANFRIHSEPYRLGAKEMIRIKIFRIYGARNLQPFSPLARRYRNSQMYRTLLIVKGILLWVYYYDDRYII